MKTIRLLQVTVGNKLVCRVGTISLWPISTKWARTSLLMFIFAISGFISSAQTLQTIFSFNGTNGASPAGGLTVGNDGNFYGTTDSGGATNPAFGYGVGGTVFEITTNGTLTTLVSFASTNGANPWAALTLGPDGKFYGTTEYGGATNSTSMYGYGMGTLFQVATNGVLTTLAFFGSTNGANPSAALTLGPDGNFYGTTEFGGSINGGTIFKLTTNGALTTLVSFGISNGAVPTAGLTLGNDGVFYGTTSQGGTQNGTVFKVTTNGTLTTLVSFNIYGGPSYPYSALTLGSDGNFYGTSEYGGSDGYGTVFKVTTNGALTTLVSFTGANGKYPEAALTQGNDGNFYGTTGEGGIINSNYYSGEFGMGTLFKMTTNGTLTTLVLFNYTNGAYPGNALTLGPDGSFYGTTGGGGITNFLYPYSCGTLFRLLLPPFITSLPLSCTNNAGSTTTFTVVASGTLPSYQWFKDSSPILGAVLPTLTLTNVQDTDMANYTVVLTNAAGSVSSAPPATLIVDDPPVITTQPTNLLMLSGSNITFGITLTGTTPFDYQWFFCSSDIAGAMAQTYDGFVYGAIVTNAGSDYSTAPQILFLGGGGSGAGGTASISNGQVVSITITNAGSDYTNPPTILIDPPNELLFGQTNATINLSAITTNNAGNYYVVISNSYGCITSSLATLTIAYAPSLMQQPISQLGLLGTNVNFNVTATGTPPFSYQWWMAAGKQSNATAVPVVTNGFVLGANMASEGAGYLAVPSVKFVGGSGSGAIGTAVVSNEMVTAINMSSAGSGYTTPPVIQIAAPTASILTGQTSSVLSLTAVNFTNTGNYFVVVTNNYGSVTSQVAVLTIVLPSYNQISSQLLGSGNMRFSFEGIAGANYALDRSFSLAPANWVPVITNPADSNGVLVFTNTPNMATNNFWRIRFVP